MNRRPDDSLSADLAKAEIQKCVETSPISHYHEIMIRVHFSLTSLQISEQNNALAIKIAEPLLNLISFFIV